MLTIAEAKRFFLRIEDKKDIDKETGLPKEKSIPGPYRITLSDGQWISITKRNGFQTFSVKRMTAEERDFGGRLVKPSVEELVFTGSWGAFERTYRHCGMPTLAKQGMELADAEAQARRAA